MEPLTLHQMAVLQMAAVSELWQMQAQGGEGKTEAAVSSALDAGIFIHSCIYTLLQQASMHACIMHVRFVSPHRHKLPSTSIRTCVFRLSGAAPMLQPKLAGPEAQWCDSNKRTPEGLGRPGSNSQQRAPHCCTEIELIP